MGRELTAEERREFEERRAKEAPAIAAGLGLTLEKYESNRKRALEEAQAAARNDILTEEEFRELVDSLATQFSDEMFRSEFRRVAEKRRKKWKSGDVTSLREEIMLDFEGMKKSEEFRK